MNATAAVAALVAALVVLVHLAFAVFGDAHSAARMLVAAQGLFLAWLAGRALRA